MAIIITVSSKNEAKQMAASGLQSRRMIEIVEKNWNASPRFVCLRCWKFGHECQNNCGDSLKKCTMCARAHSTREHQCKVKECDKEKKKLCVYVVAECANCQGNYQGNFS